MNLPQLFFKALRRFQFVSNILKNLFYITKVKTLYPERFFVSEGISMGKGFNVSFDASASKIVIGKNGQFRDYCKVFSGGNGLISIGDNNFFNNYCSINALNLIKIGNNCQFGEGVRIYDHNHKTEELTELISRQGYSLGEIIIGDNCWIGSDVVVLKNVQIGDNVVVGAGCIIHKSIPSNSVIVNKQELIIKKFRQ